MVTLTVFSCVASRNKRAPGYRERGHGGLSHVGSYGFSCSSSVSTTNGMYLDFRVTGLYPNLAGGRAYSFQLRCLSE